MARSWQTTLHLGSSRFDVRVQRQPAPLGERPRAPQGLLAVEADIVLAAAAATLEWRERLQDYLPPTHPKRLYDSHPRCIPRRAWSPGLRLSAHDPICFARSCLPISMPRNSRRVQQERGAQGPNDSPHRTRRHEVRKRKEGRRLRSVKLRRYTVWITGRSPTFITLRLSMNPTSSVQH